MTDQEKRLVEIIKERLILKPWDVADSELMNTIDRNILSSMRYSEKIEDENKYIKNVCYLYLIASINYIARNYDEDSPFEYKQLFEHILCYIKIYKNISIYDEDTRLRFSLESVLQDRDITKFTSGELLFKLANTTWKRMKCQNN